MTVPLWLIGFAALMVASVGACLALLRLTTGKWGRGLCWMIVTGLCCVAFAWTAFP